MGLDLYFREDIARLLASKAQAAARYTGEEYRQGYMDALADLALAFGLTAPEAGRLRPQMLEAEPWQYASKTAYQHTSIPARRER